MTRVTTRQSRKPADQFGTTTARPPHFDDFWAAIMAEANAIPLNPTIDLRRNGSDPGA